MGTLKNFSEELYNFHKTKESQYESINSLCDKAEAFFLDELKKVDEREFARTHLIGITSAAKKAHITKWMESIIGRMKTIVMKESENDLNAAMEFFHLLFHKDGTPIYRHSVADVNAGTDFYRMRTAEKYQRYDRKGIFIISDSKRNLVGSQRFNPSGYACLYLASNLYLAWEELRRPDFDTVNFSRFRNIRELKVLDVTIRTKMLYQEHFLMAFLTLLCCAKAEDSDKHKFQYIVPHLLMKALCNSQRLVEKTSKMMLDGIRYTSSRRYDLSDFLFQGNRRLSTAYVFPQHPHKAEDEVCPHLAKLFRLTEPRTYFLYKTHRLNFYNRSALTSEYMETLFYQMEEMTKKDKLERYDIN